MSNPDADEGPQDLGGQIDDGRLPRQFAAQGKCSAYRRIEMCTRRLSENQNEHCQDRAGGKRVAQKCQSLVTPDSGSAMIPEPITVASRKAVPSASAASRCAGDGIRLALWRD